MLLIFREQTRTQQSWTFVPPRWMRFWGEWIQVNELWWTEKTHQNMSFGGYTACLWCFEDVWSVSSCQYLTGRCFTGMHCIVIHPKVNEEGGWTSTLDCQHKNAIEQYWIPAFRILWPSTCVMWTSGRFHRVIPWYNLADILLTHPLGEWQLLVWQQCRQWLMVVPTGRYLQSLIQGQPQPVVPFQGWHVYRIVLDYLEVDAVAMITSCTGSEEQQTVRLPIAAPSPRRDVVFGLSSCLYSRMLAARSIRDAEKLLPSNTSVSYPPNEQYIHGTATWNSLEK